MYCFGESLRNTVHSCEIYNWKSEFKASRFWANKKRLEFFPGNFGVLQSWPIFDGWFLTHFKKWQNFEFQKSLIKTDFVCNFSFFSFLLFLFMDGTIHLLIFYHEATSHIEETLHIGSIMTLDISFRRMLRTLSLKLKTRDDSIPVKINKEISEK